MEGEDMDSLERAKEILAKPKAANYAQVAVAYALIALVEEMRGRPEVETLTVTVKANEG